ncbi:ATP synthase F1 subunit epsilon [Leptospira wolffii]|uniref:ATP synthase epsilon chain n=1 Tax=Leptospira wolffii TaxID=409998 RepID=A0A2M9Z839_9LEPT|nr:ATP synthase F1 subunit epsilon [Leptospira wolffii]EPG67738.1 ATP synthase F1, epsilon subunit [Leptospira wolffii serovar Khorat str. Khorat-H2]PJZ64601.1 ATP synthase F1 subunit epsilon [Leptospira wolffii]TGK55153.1 ATP synthase F1 subunit epsilon [Leptospira wolffii]TGK70546.1 ATP synthase F1 subunit epsilon [Leptospira wolffii]TGK77606.1 ATP synthase F1 subunit epsilon [Leptospira wolffii]
MAAKLDVSVISPEKLLFHGDADSIVVPGSEGFFGVYPGHTALVSLLGIGVLEVRQGNKTKVAAIEGGFFEVRDNKVTILTDHGSLKEDIDLAAAQKALEEAEALPASNEKNTLVQKAKTRILAASR